MMSLVVPKAKNFDEKVLLKIRMEYYTQHKAVCVGFFLPRLREEARDVYTFRSVSFDSLKYLFREK